MPRRPQKVRVRSPRTFSAPRARSNTNRVLLSREITDNNLFSPDFSDLVTNFALHKICFSTLSLLFSVLYICHFEPVSFSASALRLSPLLMTTPAFTSLGLPPRRPMTTLVESSDLATALYFEGVVIGRALHLMYAMLYCVSVDE